LVHDHPATPVVADATNEAGPFRIGIVVSRYDEELADRLLAAALEVLQRSGECASPEIVDVPAAFEIPVVALALAVSGRCDAIVTLGSVVQGDTPHFQFVAGECAAGLMDVNVKTGVPCMFGVLTTNNRQQALDRTASKGAEVAAIAVEMSRRMRQLRAAGSVSPG
jgi:6,7-dimethyl-8-ribityllumazine synthase